MTKIYDISIPGIKFNARVPIVDGKVSSPYIDEKLRDEFIDYGGWRKPDITEFFTHFLVNQYRKQGAKVTEVPLEEAGNYTPEEETKPEQRGLMIAFYLKPEDQQALAVKGGEPSYDLHLTLAFLGTIDQLQPDAMENAKVVCEKIAAKFGAITGRTSGIGRFSGLEKDPVYAAFSCYDLGAMRHALVQELEAHGIPPSKIHGYSPHITLAYVSIDENTPITRLADRPLHLDTLTVACAGQRFDYPLKG